MILKTDSGFLEVDEEIIVEKKVKLFEDVSATEGDFSYSFTIPKTQPNISIIKIYSINNTLKPWMFKIPTKLQNDSGIDLYNGFIRIESENDIEYSASFFSGNTNWIDELDFNLLDINWNTFDKSGRDFTSTKGVVTPLTDRGMLLERRSALFHDDDFQGYIYVKDVVRTAINGVGIKLNGDLINDPIYNNLITSVGTNRALENEISKRSIYAANTTTQTVTSSYATVLFPSVAAPYFNSSLNNWSTVLSRYTFDILTKYSTIEYRLIFSASVANYFDVRVLKNGTDTIFKKSYSKTKIIHDKIENIEWGDVGDYYELQIRKSTSFFTDRTMVAGSWIKVYPTRFYKIFAASIIPDMTVSLFLTNVFRMLNMLITYNHNTKTITANNFDRILESEPIDLSDHVSSLEMDYKEFISDYSKNNLMTWQDQSNDFIDNFNESNLYPYASGNLQIDNDFLEDEGSLLEMDFSSCWQQQYGFLGMELPFTDFGTTQVIDTRDLTSVSQDTSGGDSVAVFNYSGSEFDRGYVVRISESTIEEYNGEYYAFSLGASEFFAYTPYLGNATGKVEVLEFTPSSSDPVFLLNNPNLEIGNISSVDVFYVGNLAPQTTIAVANFLPTVNFKMSLSFDDLKNRYFRGTEKLLNNGVKSKAVATLPLKVYDELDFTKTVKVNENVFYVNTMTGYQSSSIDCDIDLIKL